MKDWPSVAIVGAGIAGLSAAWQLGRLSPNARIVILEKASRVGGRIQIDPRFAADHGAHYFLKSDTTLWRLLGHLRLRGAIIKLAEHAPTFDVGGHREAGWPDKVVSRLYGHTATAASLGRLFRAVEHGTAADPGSEARTFRDWLVRQLGRDARAHAFVRAFLGGELCAPHSHVTPQAGIAALESLLSNEESWYCLRGGMVILVKSLASAVRHAGVRVMTGWEAQSLRSRGGSQLIIEGVRDHRRVSEFADAAIVASPLDGRLRISRSQPRRCYHGYISVLFRVPSRADPRLRLVCQGALYTDGRVNCVTREGLSVYRILIPDAMTAPLRSTARLVRHCRAELSRALPEMKHELRNLRPRHWSVRRWRIGLPCSRRGREVPRVPGIFLAGDWTAEHPSVEGAAASGLDAAAQVHGFLAARTG